MNTLTPYSPPTDYSPIERADLSPKTQHQYKRALQLMQEAQVNPFDFDQLASYASTLPTSARAFLKAALALMLSDLLVRAQAGATIANLDKIQVLWHRVQAMNQAIQTHRSEPQRLPHWLTQTEVDTILTAAYRDSLRDYVVLALLFGAGLRRDELVKLTYDNISQLDGKTIITLRGKGDKKRSVPITDNLARHLAEWRKVSGDGYIARSINRYNQIGTSLSASGVYNIVRQYGLLVGISDLDPHDCRRSFGRLVYQKTNDIIQVMSLLGHADTKTTLHYIGATIQTEAVQIVNQE